MLQLVLKMVDTSLATRFKISINKFYIVQPPLLVAISTHDVLQINFLAASVVITLE